ncbi:MAG: CoA pyrophosphatase [Anaerolineae bacterium]|nr:CoA pyrophosphatase [Anaerolineae bacterium]
MRTQNQINTLLHFRNALKNALEAPLPGEPAHLKMAPPNRISQPSPGKETRTSAVLILLYPTPDGIVIPFTLRLDTLAHHPGEICFPGGGVEEGDSTLEFTALRETAEELGLDPSSVQILGSLTPLYVSASRNFVHPIVGWVSSRPVYSPSSLEVERIIEIQIERLIDRQNIGTHYRQRGREVLTAPCYRINSDSIWGATAMILSELLTIITTIYSVKHS